MNSINENVKVIDTKDKTLNEQIVINYLNKLKNPFIVKLALTEAKPTINNTINIITFRLFT